MAAAPSSAWLRWPWPRGRRRDKGEAAKGAAIGEIVDRVRRLVQSSDSMAHLAWYSPRVEAYRKAELEHVGETCYLDYAGAALFGRAQLAAATEVLLSGVMANPHTSPSTANLIADARAKVLELFGVSAETHTVIFTSGATQALQLVGENFAWSSGSKFLYSEDNHTSVVGLRQYAKRAAACCGCFALEDLPQLAADLARARPLPPAGPWPAADANAANLLAFPGESNFSGARADLSCVARLRAGPHRWRVLLDAAKLACSPGALDLATCPADFAVVSFYKIFGYPTGLGALLVRHDAAPLLAPSRTMGADAGPEGAFGPSYFAGGGVASVSATSGFAVPRPALAEWLERGTSHFQGIAVLPSQLECLQELGSPELRRRHMQAVCREAYVRMRALRHRNGRLLCTIFGRHDEPKWWLAQGPTIACVMYYADGTCIPYGLVAEKAKARSIILRTGCHCNAGACMKHLGLTDQDIKYFFASGKVCGDDMGVIDGRHTGAVRVSFGSFSTAADVHRWIALLEEELLDQLPVKEPCETCVRPDAMPAVVPSGAADALAELADSAGRIVSIKVYPIKGCGPLRVRRWPLDPNTGALFLDRRWCLALGGQDASPHRVRPISAKQAPLLTKVQLSLRKRKGPASASERLALILSAKGMAEDLEVPLTAGDEALLLRSGAALEEEEPQGETGISAGCDDIGEETAGTDTAQQVAAWFERLLSLPAVRFVEASSSSSSSAGTGEPPARGLQQHFANAPSTLLLVSTASLRDFGRLCGLPVPSERFRANLEVDFSVPYVEASWPEGSEVRLGSAAFEAAGRCVRCQAVDIDPEDPTAKGPSLLAALATAQAGGSGGSKGPTFGTLLRPQPSRAGAPVLAIGMAVEHEPCPRQSTEVKVFV